MEKLKTPKGLNRVDVRDVGDAAARAAVWSDALGREVRSSFLPLEL